MLTSTVYCPAARHTCRTLSSEAFFRCLELSAGAYSAQALNGLRVSHRLRSATCIISIQVFGASTESHVCLTSFTCFRAVEKITRASSVVDEQIWGQLGNCLTETDLGIGKRTVVGAF